MSGYDSSRSALGGVYTINSVGSSAPPLEPVITPDELRNLYLFGIPLISGFKDPVTGALSEMTDTQLEAIIRRSVANAEIELQQDIYPRQYDERLAFDRAEFESFGYMRLRHRPIQSIQRVSIFSSDQVEIYRMPLEWIEVGYLQWGQIHILPISSSLGSGGMVPNIYGNYGNSTSGATWFLNLLGSRAWVPAFWQVCYTTGYAGDANNPAIQVPNIINDLIGTIAAIEVIGMIAPTYAYSTGHSLSIDAMSQSVSSLGPNLFKTRMEELNNKRAMLIGRLKAMYSTLIFSDNV